MTLVLNRRQMTAERRAQPSDITRRAQAERTKMGRERIWTDDRIALVRSAFAAGGRAGAIAAFPDMRPSQVCAALRRYCLGPDAAPIGGQAAYTARSANRCWEDPSFHRRFLEALTGMTQFESER
jgi:hypothetical protein